MTAFRLPLALLLDSVGAGEWFLLVLVALVIYGPRRLPGIMRSLGRWIGKVNQTADQFRQELNRADLDADEDRVPSPPPDAHRESSAYGDPPA
jgi:Sec-independent protein translocase protein TatA